jgi:hypothetical protein
MSQADSTNTTAERFAAAYAELAAYLPIYEEALDRRHLEISRRTGIEPHWNFRTDDEARTHLAVMTVVDAEIAFDKVSDQLNALYERLDPIVNQVMRAPAQDISSVALKANAVATAMPHLWESLPNDLDYPDRLLRDLIESFCVVAGVELLVRSHSQPRTDLN